MVCWEEKYLRFFQYTTFLRAFDITGKAYIGDVSITHIRFHVLQLFAVAGNDEFYCRMLGLQNRYGFHRFIDTLYPNNTSKKKDTLLPGVLPFLQSALYVKAFEFIAAEDSHLAIDWFCNAPVFKRFFEALAQDDESFGVAEEELKKPNESSADPRFERRLPAVEEHNRFLAAHPCQQGEYSVTHKGFRIQRWVEMHYVNVTSPETSCEPPVISENSVSFRQDPSFGGPFSNREVLSRYSEFALQLSPVAGYSAGIFEARMCDQDSHAVSIISWVIETGDVFP